MYETPHCIAMTNRLLQSDPTKWKARCYHATAQDDSNLGWYTELLYDGVFYSYPGHLCGRKNLLRYVVLGIDEKGLWLYYGGRQRQLAHQIMKMEKAHGTFVIEVEQLPTAPNKHDYPEYQVRSGPSGHDANTVVGTTATSSDSEEQVQS